MDAREALIFLSVLEKRARSVNAIQKPDLSEILKKALEKQIQKEPELEGNGYADGQLVYDTWICPACGEEYELDYDEYKYCPECGQAIDWKGSMIKREVYW